MSKPEFVYVTYIETTPERIWDALTSSELSRHYWFGTDVRTDWRVGAPIALITDGMTTDVGEILEFDPPRRLSYAFTHVLKDAVRHERPTKVVFAIEPHGHLVKLTLTHEGFDGAGKLLDAVSNGWPAILSGLKSLLETGTALSIPMSVLNKGRCPTDFARFMPATVYTSYIAASAEKVWEALTSAEFSRQYFFGNSVQIEQKVGGNYIVRQPDGALHINGEVIECDPPRKLAFTFNVNWPELIEKLGPTLVSYEIEPAGDAVRLTMTEWHERPLSDDILSGGRQGWPAILSSLKSLLETGKPLAVKMAPPARMLAALKAMGIAVP